jgi:hypothetical protein
MSSLATEMFVVHQFAVPLVALAGTSIRRS